MSPNDTQLGIVWSHKYEELGNMTHQETRISRWEVTESIRKPAFRATSEQYGM